MSKEIIVIGSSNIDMVLNTSCFPEQGKTVIAAIWGIFIWKEFANASIATYRIRYFMLLLYLTGIVLIILANI